jgi:hypothetical protein
MAMIAAAGCSDRDTEGLAPATGDDNPDVFIDGYAPGVTYQAFLNSKTDAVQIDGAEGNPTKPSLVVTVPGPSVDPPWFAGGAFTNEWGRDLSGYNALTFYAKAEKTAMLDVAGFANDNTGNSKYEGFVDSLRMSTEWQKYVLPIPDPSRLTVERGLLFFAEGHENNQGYQFWMDEIKFETVAGLTNPRGSMPTVTIDALVGDTLKVDGCKTIFDFGDSTITAKHLHGYFTFTSSNPSVVSTAGGLLKVVGIGEATLTATLRSEAVAGEITVSGAASPSVAAPTPTEPSADVISVYSDAYTDVPVSTFSPTWDLAEVADITIAGNNTKKYTLYPYAAIEFTSPLINASAMSHFHIDFFASTGSNFMVKLVDFGANGMFGGGDDTEETITIDAVSTPPFAAGSWVSLDIPLTEFTNGNLASTEHLAQLFLESDSHTVYIDNIYFYIQR